MRIFVLILLSGFIEAHIAWGQPDNVTVYQGLAVDCFGSISEAMPALKLTAPTRMPFVRSALVTHWTGQGRRVFLADSAYTGMPANLAHFTYRIEAANVRYARLRKKRAARTIDFTLAGQLYTAAGEVLWDDLCRRQFADTLAIADLNAIESSTYPETQAPHPQGGWARRVLEPIVLSAATVVGVYLFFTLRSNSSEDSGS